MVVDARATEPAAAAQRAWITQVLGYDWPKSVSDGPDSAAAVADDRPAMIAAVQAALDQQTIALQKAFEQSDDPRGVVIARQGLGRMAARLHAHLAAIAAALEDGGADAAKPGLDALRQFVAADPAFPFLERNPFGIAVTIRADLERMATALEPTLREA